MDQYIRKEIKKIFPNNDLIEIPANHAIFKTISFTYPKYMSTMENVLRRLGFSNNRLVLLYTFECDLGNGWEDPEVHNPTAIREKR
jgi:hypothetical protein